MIIIMIMMTVIIIMMTTKKEMEWKRFVEKVLQRDLIFQIYFLFYSITGN